MKALKLTSCMAPNADGFVVALTQYLASLLPFSIESVMDVSWQEREQGFDAGEIQICWICGLPYAWKADNPFIDIELLVAPVIQGSRYQNKAVYFSDIVVHVDSDIINFDDLQGKRWAYNEAQSHSGSYVARDYLANKGKDRHYFSEVIESGAHQHSLQMILDGRIDASAIDTWVLALELKNNPHIAAKIRIIDTLGPSAFPPWLISTQVPLVQREAIRTVMLNMHKDPIGREILTKVEISHFTQVSDCDYDSIRQMAANANTVPWNAAHEADIASAIKINSFQ